MNDPRYQTLIAKSAQEIDGTMETVPTVEAVETPLKIKAVYSKDKNDPIDYTHLRCGGHTLLISRWRDTGEKSLSWIAGPMRTVHDIDVQIALLQRAKEIMGGGA